MLEQQRGMIESSHFDKQVFTGLSEGKKAVDAIQKDLDIDDMQDLQDEIAEQQEKKAEIDSFFVKHAED